MNNGESSIEYSTPKRSIEKDEIPQHRFDLIVDGKEVGAAEIDYFSRPLPMYQLTSLWVDPDKKGQGYASQILDKVESFLRKKKRPGILADGIMEGDPASGMYGRRGWVLAQESIKTYVYNWPKDVPFSVLDGNSFRYLKILKDK